MDSLFILSLFYVTAVMSCLLSCRLTLFCPIEELDFLVFLHRHGWIDSKKDSKKDRAVTKLTCCPYVPSVLNPFTLGESFRSFRANLGSTQSEALVGFSLLTSWVMNPVDTIILFFRGNRAVFDDIRLTRD
jgi:hypothetical protein